MSKKTAWFVLAFSVILVSLSIIFFISRRDVEEAESSDLSVSEYRPETEKKAGGMDDTETAGDIPEALAPLLKWGFEFPREPIVAPPFEALLLDQSSIALSQYQGNILILNFWATWCPPCKEEIPSLEELYHRLPESGIQMLAISSAERAGTVEAFVEEQIMSFPIALDPDGTISNHYGLQAIPTTYLIDREGYFIARKTGGMDWADQEWVDFLMTM